MGCLCDGGYTGADCSQRMCKVGTDPLYFDNNATLRYSNFTYQIYESINGGSPGTVTGNYSLIFYDAYGEDWQTKPIDIDATCDTITMALEELPNDVIPKDSVRCFKSFFAGGSAGTFGQDAALIEPIRDVLMYVRAKYTLAFPNNPGKLRQIGINKYLDGTRATLYTDETTSTLGWHIYPNGFLGENTDMVPDRCHGVTVNILAGSGASAGTHYLSGITTAEAKLLKRCLGDANGIASDNEINEVYNWDFGSVVNPHLIKLQDATEYTKVFDVDSFGDILYDPQDQYKPKTQLCDRKSPLAARYGTSGGIDYCADSKAPGFYAVLVYDTGVSSANPFRLWSRVAQNYGSTTPFYVYTTTGYLQRVSAKSAVYTYGTWDNPATRLASHHSNVVNFANTDSTYSNYFGDISCETNGAGVNGAIDCIDKNDMVILIAPPTVAGDATIINQNPIYTNIYTVEKIGRARKSINSTSANFERERLSMTLDYGMNFAVSNATAAAAATPVFVYKFYPPTGYTHTGPCGTRGLCNEDTGLCDCFNGYTKDDCTCINNLVF